MTSPSPSGKLNLLFGIHNHQPVGNFDHVFEQVFEQCYRPYFEVLKPFTGIKTAAHFSGSLLEWLKSHRPDYLRMLRDLVEAGRLEILSGGFYEPLLAILPERDAIGQIKMMNRFVEDHFGQIPRGLWLAERIWAPQLPKLIAEAGIEYTIVDDTHFRYAGLQEDQLNGYYITEHQGYPLKVFPILKSLRYSIPFDLPEVTLDRLRDLHQEHGFDAVTYADDGEKFGSWPETYQWVYEERYLEKWFQALEDNASWLETLTFGEYLDRKPPTGRVYLPPASYEEMMEWSLPTPQVRALNGLKEELGQKGIERERFGIFLRGGQWDSFLTKYEESNRLHKKMLQVSRKVNQLTPEQQESSGALAALYRGQCNCAYWHGLFGGLYLNYLRHALYHNLIDAENRVDQILLQGGLALEVEDFDLDGNKEVRVSNSKLNALLAPSYGGALVELDYRPACFNLSNVLKRSEETYHAVISEHTESSGEGEKPQSIHDQIRFKESGLEQYLVYDRHERYSFMDHFLAQNTSVSALQRNEYEEQGDFVDAPYELKSGGGGGSQVALSRTGYLQNGQELRIEKTYSFSETEADCEVVWQLDYRGTEAWQGTWAVEFNFTLLAGDDQDRYYTTPSVSLEDSRMVSAGESTNIQTWCMVDDAFGFQLEFSFEPAVRLVRFPIETISQSEGGFERTYQGSCLWALWEMTLEPGTIKNFRVGLNVG